MKLGIAFITLFIYCNYYKTYLIYACIKSIKPIIKRLSWCMCACVCMSVSVTQCLINVIYVLQCYTHRYLGWKIHVLDRCEFDELAAAGTISESVVVPGSAASGTHTQ